MCNTKPEVGFRFLSVFLFVVILAPGGLAITLPELRQITMDNKNLVTTAHLVYIEASNDDRPAAGDAPIEEEQKKIMQVNNHTLTRVDAIINCESKAVKLSLTDLRDIDALLKENNLPPDSKVSVSKTKTVVITDAYEFELIGSDVTNGQPMLSLYQRPGPLYLIFDLPRLGLSPEKFLAADKNPAVSDISNDSNSLLVVDFDMGQLHGKIECAPSLGYRFRRIKLLREGHLVREIIAEDYKDIEGIPFPFLYVEKSFDEDGKIIRERKYNIQEVQLGVDLSPDDFKIFVPAGTDFLDTVLSMTEHKIKEGGNLGIDDALAIGSNQL